LSCCKVTFHALDRRRGPNCETMDYRHVHRRVAGQQGKLVLQGGFSG